MRLRGKCLDASTQTSLLLQRSQNKHKHCRRKEKVNKLQKQNSRYFQSMTLGRMSIEHSLPGYGKQHFHWVDARKLREESIQFPWPLLRSELGRRSGEMLHW